MGPEPESLWTIVLIKGFDQAKTRLSAVLDRSARQELARANARRSLIAAAGSGCVLAVVSDHDAAALAREHGVEVLLETQSRGQNTAAASGIAHAVGKGANEVLLLSSDLPLITNIEVRRMVEAGRALASPAVLAAAAIGRGGTNALYLRPPLAVDLQFGPDSLPKFQAAAQAAGAYFAIFRSDGLALDLDEPSDLELLARAQA
ncbi:MAG TPA: 2-phospho-L-lactate guanylyltransferase [Candidatus Dormibacteraeota bacterium]|jgi:2-phospho-L-lactate guanylyltransferase|nr:2-phospho-L-lactate guanylyltransferase [Candidatus Dormibacteraeota bacterium]